MRSKEVEECIDILKSDAEWNGNTLCLETVLAYIEELEEKVEGKKEIDIQAIEEDRVTCEINNLDNAKFVIRKNEDNIAMLIKAVKQLDKKIK